MSEPDSDASNVTAPDYRRRTWYPALAVGTAMVSFIAIKTGRDAIFFRDSGLTELPIAYILIAAVSIPAAMIHLAALERWGARRTRTALFFLTTLALLAFVPALSVEKDGGRVLTAFFVFVPTVFAANFAGAWLLAGDLLEGADEKTKGWAYSRIGAASMLGGVAGGFLARALSAFFPPVALIVAGSLTLISTGFIVARAHRRIRPEGMPVPGSAGDASQDGGSGTTGGVRNGSLLAMVLRQSDLLRQPYVQALLGISGLAAVAALYIDFQFYAAATLTGSNSAQFFANFYIILNGASLGLQILVAPRLQARFGVGGALMLLPTLLLGSAGVFSFGGTIQSRAILKVTEGGLKASIHRAMWEQAFLPIDRERRDVAKVLVDGLFARLSEGVAGVSLLLWLRHAYGTLTQSSLNWISWAIIGAVVLWVALTRYLRRIGCSDVSPDESAIRLPDG